MKKTKTINNERNFTSYLQPTTQLHRVYKFLTRYSNDLLDYLIKTNAVLLLPHPLLLQDIPLSNEFIESHSIYLHIPTSHFVTTNGIPGRIGNSSIYFFASHRLLNLNHSHPSQKQLSALLVETIDKPIPPTCTVPILSDDAIIHNGKLMPVIVIKSFFFYETCSWGWRRGLSKLQRDNNEFSIYREFQDALNDLRDDVGGVSFKWEFDENTTNSMNKQEEEMYLFYKKLYSSQTKQIDIWKADFNEEFFVNNMHRLFINKLFKFLWPPALSNSTNFYKDEISSDAVVQTLSKTHCGIIPKHLGVDFPSDSKAIKYAIHFLKRIDSVCSPVEKVMYMFSSFKILEQYIAYVTQDNVTADQLFPLCLYCTIRACLPYISSTVRFIEDMQIEINHELSYYYCNFLACKDFIESLCYSSLESTVNPEEYEQMVISGIETMKYDIPKKGLVVSKPITMKALKGLFSEKIENENDEFLLQYYLDIPVDEITSEDVPALLRILQDLYFQTM
ncbi:hypothetical protein QTN25_007319 [Entamoeba marina]